MASILDTLTDGGAVALVTDAGTPTVSDPGAELVRRARDAGVTVDVIPGPSAVAAALSVSGFPADRFLFLGFLPRRGRERRELLERATECPWSVVLFESPQRIGDLLADLRDAAGPDRRAAVARELTKLHEEVRVGTLDVLAGYYGSREVRGEITLVLQGAGAGTEKAVPVDPATRARQLLNSGLSRKDAARQVAAELGVPRNEAYRLVTDL
jgi:16S rRNA (cytidine1402-2'-O)-methyltransferase